MSGLSVKVAIKQEVDAEEGLVWKAEVKDWGLKAQHEILEDVLLLMQRKIVTYLQETFGSRRKISASMLSASARVEFEIEVAKDRTLNEFECEIITGDNSRVPLEKVVAAAEKITDIAKKTGKNPITILNEAKAELTKRKGKGVGE